MKLVITLRTVMDSKHICDKETLKELYDDSWEKCIRDLYETEGVGFFLDGPFELIDVEKKK